MSSSISIAMASFAPPPFTYPISSNSGLSSPSTSGESTGTSSSSLSGSATTFHFGMGSSLLVGSRVSSTTTTITSTSTSIPGNFSLWSTPIVHNVPNLEQAFLVWNKPLGLFPKAGVFPLLVTLVFHRIPIRVFLMGGIGLVVLQLVLKKQAHLIMVLDRI